MKFLRRGKKGKFLEYVLRDEGLTPTGIQISPEKLIHFGTDTMVTDYKGVPSKNYMETLENNGVDYLFVSINTQEVEIGQKRENFSSIISYLKK